MLKIVGFLAIFVTGCVLSLDECDKICPYNLRPVCASNGQTYPNMCNLEIAICKDSSIEFDYDGQCRVVISFCDTNRICPLLLDPICGTDQKTYSNKCYFRKAVCGNPELKQAYKGRC